MIFTNVFEGLDFILSLPDRLSEMQEKIDFMVIVLVVVFILLLISFGVFTFIWVGDNLYNRDGKFDFKMLLPKYRQEKYVMKKEQEVKYILDYLNSDETEIKDVE